MCSPLPSQVLPSFVRCPQSSRDPVAGEVWGQGRSNWKAPQGTGKGGLLTSLLGMESLAPQHPVGPTWAAPKRGNRGVSLILEPPSSALPGACTVPFANAWQAPLGFAESLDPVLKRRSEGGTC